MANPLADAEARFQALGSYRVTVRSLAADGERQVLQYSYRKPGWVKMVFEQPHAGVVLVYDPELRKVRLWPFGLRPALALTLEPDNPLVRDKRGHQINHSDIGTLLANLSALQARGKLTALDEAAPTAQPATGLDIEGDADVAVSGVHHYRVWLARDTLFPLRVESYDLGGGWIETVDMPDSEIDVVFPAAYFRP